MKATLKVTGYECVSGFCQGFSTKVIRNACNALNLKTTVCYDLRWSP